MFYEQIIIIHLMIIRSFHPAFLCCRSYIISQQLCLKLTNFVINYAVFMLQNQLLTSLIKYLSYFILNQHIKHMASNIKSFSVAEPICSSHYEPCSFVLIQNCRMRLVCNKCFPIYSGTGSQKNTKIMTMENFKDYLSTAIRNEQIRIRNSVIIDVHKIVQDKKKQFQNKQCKLIDSIIKSFNQDKQAFFLELDAIEKNYMLLQNRYLVNIEQRDQITKYLKQFINDTQLLKLKLKVSNQYGLSSFLAQIRSLQILAEQYTYRNTGLITKQICKQLSSKEQNSFLFKLQNFFKKYNEQKFNNILPLLNIPIIPLGRPRTQRSNQSTQRKNHSQEKERPGLKSPRSSRANSFCQLPKIPIN